MVLPAHFSLGLLVCLAIGPFVSRGQAAACPRTWLSYNGNCYGYFPQEVTWRQAQAHCQRQKASLASILDKNEHYAVADFLHRTQADDENVWIGFSIPSRSRGWVWADGSPVSYTAWERSKPSPFARNEHCAQLDEDAGFMEWDNDSCNDRNPFLCKL
ncbi:PREDICTED: dromaiocalcin-1-like [Gekko japonicus]|uniref:Dromaiocalcin-1-like n=1 Tax=Gekko japonicus TaxID=146911 RepID=A0ABM1KU90_GEKJA|nr:PREDICTED: dromaiocalcin-1-like [Gekko japonicus]